MLRTLTHWPKGTLHIYNDVPVCLIEVCGCVVAGDAAPTYSSAHHSSHSGHQLHTLLRTLSHSPRGTLYIYHHVMVCFIVCCCRMRLQRTVQSTTPYTVAAFVEEIERVPQGPPRSRMQLFSVHTLSTHITFAWVRFWLNVEVSGGQWTC